MLHTNQCTKGIKEFEYDILPPQKRASVKKITLEIRANLRKTVRTIWEIGKSLVEVRSQVETCQFNLWLRAEFDWSRRTAYNFISVYEAFPDFSSANFAQVNISISALYLLATPSIHKATRSRIMDQALSGEYISHKVVQKAIEEDKNKQVDNDFITSPATFSNTVENSSINSHQSERIGVIPNLRSGVSQQSGLKAAYPISISKDSSDIYSELRPAWNQIKKGLSLFWGNTDSPRFIENLPQDAFILAISANKCHQDWLLSKSRNFIILHQPMIEEEFLERLLLAFSLNEKAVVFPWLPDWRMIKLALKLNIKVYAGDLDLENCENLISRLGLSVAKSIK